jgi:hypothetical protein
MEKEKDLQRHNGFIIRTERDLKKLAILRGETLGDHESP